MKPREHIKGLIYVQTSLKTIMVYIRSMTMVISNTITPLCVHSIPEQNAHSTHFKLVVVGGVLKGPTYRRKERAI